MIHKGKFYVKMSNSEESEGLQREATQILGMTHYILVVLTVF